MDANLLHFLGTIAGTALGIYIGGMAVWFSVTEKVDE